MPWTLVHFLTLIKYQKLTILEGENPNNVAPPLTRAPSAASTDAGRHHMAGAQERQRLHGKTGSHSAGRSQSCHLPLGPASQKSHHLPSPTTQGPSFQHTTPRRHAIAKPQYHVKSG